MRREKRGVICIHIYLYIEKGGWSKEKEIETKTRERDEKKRSEEKGREEPY